MANAARKARKREGEKFIRETKVGTPLEQRALRPAQFDRYTVAKTGASRRHMKKIQDQIKIRDADKTPQSVEYITSEEQP